MAMVDETCGLASDISVLDNLGIACYEHASMHSGEVHEQDEIADLFGELCLVYAGRRMARCLFLVHGYPARMAGLAGGPELQAKTMSAFRRDYKEFQMINGLAQKSAAVRRLENRSPFHDVGVRQYMEAGCRSGPPLQNSSPGGEAAQANVSCPLFGKSKGVRGEISMGLGRP